MAAGGVVGDDFTVRGGSADASISAKPLMAEEMAHDFGCDHPDYRRLRGGARSRPSSQGAANLPGGIGGSAVPYTTANMPACRGRWVGSVAVWRRATGPAIIRDDPEFGDVVAGPPVVKRLGQDLTKQDSVCRYQTARVASIIGRYRGGAFACARAFSPICRRRSMNSAHGRQTTIRNAPRNR